MRRHDRRAAAEPGWAWHALVVEVAMYRNLLRLAFRRPAVTRNRELTVTRVSFWVDEPREVVRAVQERAATRAPA